ncbi:MAG: hypothetical protein AAGB31_00165 [Bdellovibrio sp.]
MKKLLVVAALMAATPAAMASKARVAALADSRQIVDIQTAFDRPYQFMALGSLATIEWGDNYAAWGAANATAQTLPAHAEGGFLMKHDDMAYGAYLGRRSGAFNNAVLAGISAGLNADALLEQNPINVFYASKMGEWTWGVNVKYSNGKNDTVDAKSNSAGLSLGAAYGDWEFEIVQGLTAKSEYGANSVESKGMTEVGVGYKINENMEAYAQYGMVKADADIGGTSSTVLDATAYEVGFVNTFIKNDEANFFYGIAYNSNKIEDSSETTTLPVWMGVEANATSWMVFRASIKQSILLNSEKDISGGANDGDVEDVDSTTFAGGVGIKLGKGMLDATFGTGTAGHLSFSDGTAGNQFLSTVAYTYNF